MKLCKNATKLKNPDLMRIFFSVSQSAVWIGLKETLDGAGYEWVDGSPLDYLSWQGELTQFSLKRDFAPM